MKLNVVNNVELIAIVRGQWVCGCSRCHRCCCWFLVFVLFGWFDWIECVWTVHQFIADDLLQFSLIHPYAILIDLCRLLQLYRWRWSLAQIIETASSGGAGGGENAWEITRKYMPKEHSIWHWIIFCAVKISQFKFYRTEKIEFHKHPSTRLHTNCTQALEPS